MSPNTGAFVERGYWPTWLAEEFSFKGGKNSPMFWSGGCAKCSDDCEWSDLLGNIGVDNCDFP